MLALLALLAVRTLLGGCRRVFVTVVTVVNGSGGGVAQCVLVARPSTREIRYVGGQDGQKAAVSAAATQKSQRACLKK